MKRFLHRNSLSIVLLGLFLVFELGLSAAGYFRENQRREEHGLPEVTYADYLVSDDFLEATAENWESEFLQMAAYAYLTVRLVQAGAAESNDPDAPQESSRGYQDLTPEERRQAPWPVRQGGWVRWLYEHSLGISLFILFLIAFYAHLAAGARAFSQEQLAHGKPAVSTLRFLFNSEFWFQSLQNWQSEFLAIAVMLIGSIFLRQRGSPVSKPVYAPHAQTGT